MVFTENPQRLLSLDQSEEIIRHCFAIEEIIYTQQKVPVKEDRSLPKGAYGRSLTAGAVRTRAAVTQLLRTPRQLLWTSRPQILSSGDPVR